MLKACVIRGYSMTDLLLGLKCTMSEFELGILRQRAQEAYRQKVLRGEVLTRVPVGYIRRGQTGIEMTPDRETQEAVGRCCRWNKVNVNGSPIRARGQEAKRWPFPSFFLRVFGAN